MLLAFQSAALNSEQNGKVSSGAILHGDRYSSSKVQLSSLMQSVGKIENEMMNMIETNTASRLRLNKHCKECGFQSVCYVAAKEKDDLSLLKGLSGKEIDDLNKKGIFTVTQYSYTFRPRRARKLQAKKMIKQI